jgi:hypothetical protein
MLPDSPTPNAPERRKGASIHTIEAPLFSLVFAVSALEAAEKVRSLKGTAFSPVGNSQSTRPD